MTLRMKFFATKPDNLNLSRWAQYVSQKERANSRKLSSDHVLWHAHKHCYADTYMHIHKRTQAHIPACAHTYVHDSHICTYACAQSKFEIVYVKLTLIKSSLCVYKLGFSVIVNMLMESQGSSLFDLCGVLERATTVERE